LNKIKSVALATLLATISTSSLEAKMNTKVLKHMSLSTNYIQGSFGDTDSSGYNLTYSFSTEFKEKYVAGVSMEVTNMDDTDSGINSIALMFGYNLAKNTTAYGELSYDYNSDEYSGVGYSLGAKYQVYNYVAINAKYHMATLTPTVGDDVDFSYGAVGLEFNFKTTN